VNLTNINSSFSSPALASVLADCLGLTPDTPLKIAFSGGLDSHVLLHALCALRDHLKLGSCGRRGQSTSFLKPLRPAQLKLFVG
jgi:hypothetical protein